MYKGGGGIFLYRVYLSAAQEAVGLSFILIDFVNALSGFRLTYGCVSCSIGGQLPCAITEHMQVSQPYSNSYQAS